MRRSPADNAISGVPGIVACLTRRQWFLGGGQTARDMDLRDSAVSRSGHIFRHRQGEAT